MFARFSQIKEVNSSKKVYEDSQELINITRKENGENVKKWAHCDLKSSKQKEILNNSCHRVIASRILPVFILFIFFFYAIPLHLSSEGLKKQREKEKTDMKWCFSEL